MMTMFRRRSLRPIVAISTPSMEIDPDESSTSRKRQDIMEDSVKSTSSSAVCAKKSEEETAKHSLPAPLEARIRDN